MAQMLAPYNNSMRLGQGFNSYTQQICLDRAVLPLPKPPTPAKGVTTLSYGTQDGAQTPATSDGGSTDGQPSIEYHPQPKDPGPTPLKVMPWVKPQIVTYSSRFVDKISDVTDAMNISGSLSIKTATIGGKANGSYIDSDKFKSSDINFHLQVKVTNQIHEPPEYCIFNKIGKVKKEEFPEVYGDCFISGWEEGGELNAVISIKVHDKSKVFEIKAGIEAEMNTPTISGKVEAEFGMEKKNLSKSTETTISVNWSGGGSIKDPTVDWSIDSLKKAAAAFPDLVAVTPQRTYAILTKYTALADFQMKKDDFSPLDYESAGIYTSALLDHYMDYKAMWKEISHATYELKGNRATIEIARPGEETYALARIEPLPATQVDAKAKLAIQDSSDLGILRITDVAQQQAKAQELVVKETNCIHHHHDNNTNANSTPVKAFQFPVFSPTFAGLIHARKVCRFEMAKIVNEVDLVAKNPKLATDTTRDAYFLNPLVFEQLLPIVRSVSPDAAKLRVKDPNAAILLGYVPPIEEPDALPPVYELDGPLEKHDRRLQNSISKCAWKAQDYTMRGCAGLHGEKGVQNSAPVHSTAVLVNDLETLDATFRITKISVWSTDNQTVRGIRLEYSKGLPKPHGSCVGDATHIWELAKDGSEIIVEVIAREGINTAGETVISSVTFVTSNCNIFDSSVPQSSQSSTTTTATTAGVTLTKTSTFLPPQGGTYSLRGLFTFSANADPATNPSGIPCSLGVIFSKDTFVPLPSQPISQPIIKSFLSLSPPLRKNVSQFKSQKSFSTFTGKLLLGLTAAAAAQKEPVDAGGGDNVSVFNALDKIDVDWTIKSIAFASKEGKLTGLKVLYQNGRELVHGSFERAVWTCEIRSDIVVVKIIAGRAVSGGKGYVDTVEMVRADEVVGGTGRKGELGLAEWPLDVATARYLGEGESRVKEDLGVVVERAPNLGGNAKWSVRGFYGECQDGVISRLGVVWGRA
ncbi:hypothetical protein QBC43DRAFT_283408 [Cladorrhinum sp. PSN259]|nr:hypothetical protein QBC43DRAFT_283408 [Cladorrhinum sp. PSN259]